MEGRTSYHPELHQRREGRSALEWPKVGACEEKGFDLLLSMGRDKVSEFSMVLGNTRSRLWCTVLIPKGILKRYTILILLS